MGSGKGPNESQRLHSDTFLFELTCRVYYGVLLVSLQCPEERANG